MKRLSIQIKDSKDRNKEPKNNKHKFFKLTPWVIVVICIVIFLGSCTFFYYRYPVSRTEKSESDLPSSTDYVEDSSIELGQQQKRSSGQNGTRETTYLVKKTLSGHQISKVITTEKTIKAPVNEIIAKGTRKYQFMTCSNGSYRYYSNDEFKNPNVGFTHQSQDYCAQNNAGHMTGLADNAPVQQTYQRSTPTYTNCYDTGLYSSSFSCFSY